MELRKITCSNFPNTAFWDAGQIWQEQRRKYDQSHVKYHVLLLLNEYYTRWAIVLLNSKFILFLCPYFFFSSSTLSASFLSVYYMETLNPRAVSEGSSKA